MHTHRHVLPIAAAALLLSSPLVGATAQRTFVASTGVDTNACSLVQPCRSFARAITQTNAGGEVIVLDSAGYGPVTIGQSVSIIAPPGIFAGISVLSGNGVTISGSGIIVVLHGLTINGQGGADGIHVIDAATVRVERCTISGLVDGIYIRAGTLYVEDSVVRNNASNGIAMNPHGVDMRARIASSVIADNGTGIDALASPATGLTVTVTRSAVSGNPIGLRATAAPTGFAAIVSDGNTVTQSDKAFVFGVGGGTELIYTPGNNTEAFNTTPVYNGSLTSCCAL